MKIAITGHKRGIGQEFARQLGEQGHEITGISRSDGENIRRTVHTASLIAPCDLFINNAISLYAQTELLFEVWHQWANLKEEHHIWNISTKLCEQDYDIDIDGLTLRESMQYRNQKMALELAHHQLNFQPSTIKMTLIRPPGVKTQSFSPAGSISANEYVQQVLHEQGMV